MKGIWRNPDAFLFLYSCKSMFYFDELLIINDFIYSIIDINRINWQI